MVRGFHTTIPFALRFSVFPGFQTKRSELCVSHGQSVTRPEARCGVFSSGRGQFVEVFLSNNEHSLWRLSWKVWEEYPEKIYDMSQTS